MVYTYSKKADLIVKRELEIIKKIIIKRIPGLVSILLFGSFGKGEGSYIKSNGKIEVIGDYDMYVVTKKSVGYKVLEKVSEECADALKIGNLEIVEALSEEYERKKFFQIDLREIVYKKLKNLLPTQRTVDLKYSKIIWGKEIADQIKDIKLSLSEALRPLFNRADYLLTGFDKPKEAKIICARKAILDSCVALLISENRYHPTYKKRNEIFQKSNFPDKFKKLVAKATKIKLKGFNPKKEDEKIWGEAKDFLGFSLKYVLEKQRGKGFKNWKEVGDFIINKLPYTYFKPYTDHYMCSEYLFPAQYYFNLMFVLTCWKKKEKVIKPVFTWKDAGLKLAASLVMYLYDEKKLAEKYLEKITNKTKPLKQRILELYILYFNQKVI